MKGFTKEEEIVMDKLVEAHIAFNNLERQHPDELKDWVVYLHHLQKLLGFRILRREHPKVFPIKE